MQTWQISQLTSVTSLSPTSAMLYTVVDHEHELTKSCRMLQNCDKLQVQVKTNCIAILTGRCIKIGSNDVMTSRSVMYKNPKHHFPASGTHHQTFHADKGEPSHFCTPPNFLGTAPPAIVAKLHCNGLLPLPMFSLLFVCLTVSNFAQELPNRFA